MAKLEIPFNASQVPPSEGGGSSFSIGKHPVKLIGQELKANKDNTGGYLAFTMEALDGPCVGTTHVDRLNIFHSNPTTVKIALEKLSAYCHVVGRPDFDSEQHEVEELFDIPFIVEVAQQKNDPKYTEIAKLYDIEGNGPTESKKKAPPANSKPAWGNQPAQQETAPAQQNAPAWGQQSAPKTESKPAGGWTPPGGAAQQNAPAAGADDQSHLPPWQRK